MEKVELKQRYVEGVADSGTPNFQGRYNARSGFGLLQVHDASPFKDLAILEEDSEEEDDDERSEGSEHSNILVKANVIQPITFSPGEVAQAFSHYSYEESRQNFLVCDLQGVFDIVSNELVLSDPVIHYYNHRATADNERRGVHGRTDRGRKGILDFFDTHKEVHGHLCCLLLKGFRKAKHR
jgi:Alpha-kinase family